MAFAFFAQPRAGTSPSPLRRNDNLRKRLCHQFAARLAGAVDARPGQIPAARLKPFAWFGILRRPVLQLARRAVVDAAQVPVRTQDFPRLTGFAAGMRRKRFTCHAFSCRRRAARARTAFGLPQRA
jgi:hypothetical protein